jgi:hypothetical protein
MKKFTFVATTLLILPFFGSALASAIEPLAGNECGVVSIYKDTPKTKNIYRVNINTIDGEVMHSKSHRFELTPGKHSIKVMELIDDRDLYRRGIVQNYHILEINVEANQKYHIGAKFDRANKTKLSDGSYWQPIIWKTSTEECKLP